MDRMSMAVGLEVRVPFCDHRLVEYVFATPWAYKIFDQREKSLLRAATADLLPKSIVTRIKSGFPVTHDPTYETMLRSRFTALLNDRDAAVAPLLAVDWCRAALKATGSGVNRLAMEQILMLEHFLTHYKPTLTI
jgi:asparagine synthase (glutamine-hydrolysing)